jgi:AcrR family transcriptional regulator
MNRREKQREQTLAEIKARARAQMLETGTAGLALGAIARAMGMTPPALYRYYAGRDDLITALIVDAYSDLAASLRAVIATRPVDDYAGRLQAAMNQYRDWALARPIDFELIFGNPIPGYIAPEAGTLPAARSVFMPFLETLQAADMAGLLQPQPQRARVPPAIVQHLADDAYYGQMSFSPLVIYHGTIGWTRIHGAIVLELFKHTPPVIGNCQAFYQTEVAAILRDAGLIERNEP